MRKSRSLLTLGVAGLAASLVLPTAGAATKKAPAGGNLIDLQNNAAGEPDHLDPQLTSTLVGAQMAILIYDGLTDTDARGEVVPAVAQSWTPNADSSVWTFKLKRNVKFTNGETVLPSSFKRGWDRAVQPAFASEVAYHFDIVKGKKEVDAKTATSLSGVVADDRNLTLTVSLTGPFTAFPSVVAHPVYSPMPKAVEKLADQTKYEAGVMIGNGPFKMSGAMKKQIGGGVKLVRNDAYYGPKAKLASIDFRISDNVDNAYNAFEAGQGQTAAVPAGRYDQAEQKYGKQGLGPVLGTDYWAFNWEDPVVGGPKNLLLRRAIALAVDRDALSKNIYQGARKPAYQLVPAGIPGYKSGLGLSTSRDVAGAKKAFEDWKAAGNKIDQPIRLSFNEGSNWDKVSTIMVDNLKEIGIDAKLDPFPNDGTYFSKMRKGGGQIVRSGWFADYPIYDNFMYPLLHSASIDGDNLARYNSPKYDQLVNDARKSTNAGTAQALYNQAESLALKDDVVIMPTTGRYSSIVFGSNVKNVSITPLGFVLYEKLELS